MRWTHYPTDRDRKEHTNGTEVTGQVWSAAPGEGNQWVLPDGLRKPVLVTTRAASHMGKPYSVGPLSAVQAPADATP